MTHVKCPECTTRYRVPKHVVNDRQRKMRCARCKNVFVMRSQRSSPPGEQESVPITESTFPASVAYPERAVENGIDEDADTSMPSVEGHKDPLTKRAVDILFADEAQSEIDSLSPETDDTHSSIYMGKFMFGFTLSIAVFFLFVAYRNGWSLSLDQFGEQVVFAFSGESLQQMPEELKGLEVTLEKSQLKMDQGQSSRYVATGLVFNNTPFRKSHIVLRGTVYDAKGKTRLQVDFPCGLKFETSLSGQIQTAGIRRLGSQQKHLPNCVIGPEGAKKYHLVLSLPDDYEEYPQIDVRPVSARLMR